MTETKKDGFLRKMLTPPNMHWQKWLSPPRRLLAIGSGLLSVLVFLATFLVWAQASIDEQTQSFMASTPTLMSSTGTKTPIPPTPTFNDSAMGFNPVSHPVTNTPTPTPAPTPTLSRPSPTPGKPVSTASSFRFTAAGDYAQTTYTTANLEYIARSGANFHLALGDLNYDPAHVTAEQWSDYVKSHLPPGFPFEVLVGNEDEQADALIDELSNHIGNISGIYGKEYSFDYPSGAPLARFIFASPGGILAGYSYAKGSPHYNWVAQQIDGARSAGIPWVIVGMHEYCIVMNSTIHSDTCASVDLTNLLLSKKVDLILYGHKHNFQVSKQLALNSTTCMTLTIGAYNPSCVVSASTSLTRGAGSVMIINGSGGDAPLATIDTSDPEVGYFRSWEGGNSNPTWGISRFTVTPTQITAQYVGVSGSFSDSFTIHS